MPEELPATSGDSETPDEELAHKVEEVLSGKIPNPSQRKKAVEAVVMAVHQYEAFRGPLPHPRHLEHYNQVLPGAAERILSMTERSLEHQIDWEAGVRTDEYKLARLSQWFGGVYALGLVAAVFYATYAGQPSIAYAALAAGAIGGIAVLVKGRSIIPPQPNGKQALADPPTSPQRTKKPKRGR